MPANPHRSERSQLAAIQALLVKARRFLSEGQPQETLRICNHLHARLPILHHPEIEPEIYELAGRSLFDLSSPKDAARALVRAVRLRRSSGDPLDLARTLSVLGSALGLSGKPRTAIVILRRSISLYPKGQPFPSRLEDQIYLASLLLEHEDLDGAASVLREVQLSDVSLRHLARVRVADLASRIFLRLGDALEAKKWLEALYQIGVINDLPYVMVESLCGLAELYLREGDSWRAQEALSEALNQLRHDPNPRELAHVQALLRLARSRQSLASGPPRPSRNPRLLEPGRAGTTRGHA